MIMSTRMMKRIFESILHAMYSIARYRTTKQTKDIHSTISLNAKPHETQSQFQNNHIHNPHILGESFMKARFA